MAAIEMHSSWLAINSILGCPNGCKYCLLQATGDNNCFPKQLITPEEAVEELLKYKYYDKKIPLCLLPNTDVFVNPKNTKYLLELLDELEKHNVKNDLIIITKCKIPDEVIERAKSIKENNQNIVFYISYSGLGKKIEPRISEEILRDNLKRLNENGIDVIHYYRPFLPQNSNPAQITEILDYVNQYTDVSVTTGLALIETFIDKIECWDEVKENKEKCLKANCVWPESAWNYFNNNYTHKQQIFQTNTCGLNTKLKRPSTQYYNSFECQNYNHCSEEQRKRCRLAHQELNKEMVISKCQKLLEKLEFDTKDIEYIFDEYGSLELKNVELKISDASYLSYILGVKVYVSTNNIVSDTYNSTLNGAKPLVLKAGVKYE